MIGFLSVVNLNMVDEVLDIIILVIVKKGVRLKLCLFVI